MINPTDNINTRPLGPGCTPNPTITDPIAYHYGWLIHRWTGWKAGYEIVEFSDIRFLEKPCAKCGKHFNVGDRFVESQGTDLVFHFECSDYPLKDKILGQWVAVKKGDKEGELVTEQIGPFEARIRRVGCNDRFAYASVTGSQGKHEPFASFCVEPQEGQEWLTPETQQEILEAAREDGLRRLKQYIDDVEEGRAPWPAEWGPKPS